MTNSRINIIVAHSRNMAIGKANDLPWDLPNDRKRIKDLTMGHPVVMGRRTWESLPEKVRPLPGRTNIVITRDVSYEAPGATLAHDLESALEVARRSTGAEEIFIFGGGEIYKIALPITDRLYVTEVDVEVDGDAFFPEYKDQFTREISRENHEHKGLKYSYVVLER